MLSQRLTRNFPDLRTLLAQANLKVTPEDFIADCLKKSLMVTVGLNIVLTLMLLKFEKSLVLLAISLPVIYFVMFFYFMNMPKTIIKTKINEIDREIIYAGRFLLVELSAGVPLFEAMRNASKSYKYIGKHFNEILERLEIGMPIDKAIDEVLEITPADNFRKIMWQINNSLKTGGDVTVALKAIIEQISKEQMIAIQNYGKKLNPLIMFYLIIAVIFPSLGIAMLALLGGFVGNIKLEFIKAEPPFVGTLFLIMMFILFMQFMFLSIIRSSRPGVEIE